MLNKYDFTNKDDVIDQPSILKITSDLVLIIHAGGTDTEEIPEEGLVILIGNIDSFIPPTPDPIIPDDPEPTPTPIPEDGITMTVMIVNNADGNLNIKNLSLLLWNDAEQQIENVTGVVTTNNKIPQSNSRICTVVFENADDYAGMYFATQELYAGTQYSCNCGYSTQNSNSFFTMNDVASTYVFMDNGSFTVEIPQGTTEWTGGGQTPDYDVDPEPTPTPTPTPDPSTPDYAPTPTIYSTAAYTGGNGIKFVITNNTDYEARFSGAITLNLSKSPNDWANSTQAYAHIVDASKGIPDQNGKYHKNNIVIPAGGTYTSPAITTITGIYMPATNFTDGTWYLMNSINGVYGYPIFLYTREYSRSRNATSGSQNMYAASPTQNAVLQMGYTYYLNLYWKNPYASLDPDKSGVKYIILAENQENLLPTS